VSRSDLQVPRRAKSFRGSDSRRRISRRGPLCDHTGYYNEREAFPVFTVERMTLRRDPIYHSTYTGKPPTSPRCSARR